jgi:HK97 family phage prohead protease
MVRPLTAAASLSRRIDTENYVEGYAATFNDPYLLAEWDGVEYYEQIDSRAVVGADMSDVIMQYDHAGKVLARQTNGTLGVEADSKGIFMYADLSKSRAAQDMHEEITNGLITKMSWAFTIEEDSYNKDTHTRTILKIAKVYDVSAVSYPANPDTDISARTFFDGVIEDARRSDQARQLDLLKLRVNLEVWKNEISRNRSTA